MHKRDLLKSIEALKNGKIVVYPTDTLYALGADIYNKDAIKKIFEIKRRPFNIPLPVAVSNSNEIERVAFVDVETKRFIKRFLPGPLTVILYKKDMDLDMVVGGLDKIAIRIPNNKIALELLSKFGGPLTATSANIHGKETPHVIKEIKMQFNKEDIAAYLDYGILAGEPSTIVDLTTEKPIIVRKGIITEEEILDAIQHG
ncbi:MAG: threonylcarbamoyl-AMP synthase [Candidatus Asgardarchaeum californiense]|nr:MAG: threonylcarbamoyl-AMP synthase [Candidatus Asgardarchaeum californiense]